ncbi:hypothetical protein [Streptomyces albospinus]|uniref:hypothetical protein n=1 Tax=Streptomyces albospinus TaxID=285515 RepID=UPI0016700504|nr:hypothetical protein [Streptomyces albospinus]
MRPNDEFSIEAQAQIVEDWFAGSTPAGTDQTGQACDTGSPYFQYITGNIRTGST